MWRKFCGIVFTRENFLALMLALILDRASDLHCRYITHVDLSGFLVF